MKNPLISIIVPAYKVEKYLRRCINSIINQTYTNLEIILVDDGSPDNCGKICDEYAGKDQRIKVIHKENGGLSDARNRGLDIAKGEYIGFIDSDDWIKEDYIEKLLNLINDYNADISICNLVKVYNENQQINADYNPEIKIYTNIQALEQYFDKYYTNMVIACCKLYKAELINGIRFPVGKIHEDEFTTHKLLYKANKTVMTTEGLYYYLQRNDSIMGKGFNLKGSLHHLEALEERLLFYKKAGLEGVWKKTIKVYFMEITFIYGELLKYGGSKEELLALYNRFNSSYETLPLNKFSYIYKTYFFMFIRFPKIVSSLYRSYFRVRQSKTTK
jgi:glycosyltransferase involved in cell wall biosynthesis